MMAGQAAIDVRIPSTMMKEIGVNMLYGILRSVSNEKKTEKLKLRGPVFFLREDS
jgi:hypothetical protein